MGIELHIESITILRGRPVNGHSSFLKNMAGTKTSLFLCINIFNIEKYSMIFKLFF